MTIDSHLESKFFKSYLKKYKTAEDYATIFARNILIRNQFKLTPFALEQFAALNRYLISMEKRVFNEYRTIKSNAETMVANGAIEDYNLLLQVSFWTTYFDKFDNEASSDPIYSVTHFVDFLAETNEYTLLFNFDCSPMPIENQCYSFHDLYDYSGLTLFDITNIENIWMEIKVDYQFMTTC